MDELIDAWVEEQLASSPPLSAEQWERISLILGIGEAGQGSVAHPPSPAAC
ncbi:hypothetical protein AB0F71_25405 [Kitasatospora sp. NPDC028055]|uniref:hypothetical protein n=1 Tax=Kitasatospora TaxID=2063 RepID=UPI0033F24E8F